MSSTDVDVSTEGVVLPLIVWLEVLKEFIII